VVRLVLPFQRALDSVERPVVALWLQRLARNPAREGDERAVTHHVDAGAAAAENAAGRDLDAAGYLVARVEVADEACRGERALGPDLVDAPLERGDRSVEVVERLALDPSAASGGELERCQGPDTQVQAGASYAPRRWRIGRRSASLVIFSGPSRFSIGTYSASRRPV
jgi:hypothetical protein